ncbi:chemotaxis protein CheW [Xanthobacter tagetidis]|uniref:CheW-like domain-containing protein n=1 Tax=Xanthobacter tagetidis TaxID=60216 RepID=A0A3L7AIY5_9HYPH|nr:chemotaxis protein CheW [Xanthobacter tagetidis]MBB6309174.1 chemotaxis signal transduction protein [Xanthobacter tagetidis]RLP80349.1 hypothetical protein D9R14_04560 [Xanthobacter tagetidis]
MSTLEERRTIVVARCGDMRVGIPVDTVRKVIAAPLPSPLPEAPAIVAGLLNLHGEPLVVVDLARRGGGARDAITLASRIVVVETPSQQFGLLCETVEGVRVIGAQDWLALDEIVPGIGYLAASAAGEEQLIVLRDPGTWLSASDVEDLRVAVDRHQSGLAS